MEIERYTIGGYWRARRSTKAEAAHAIYRFLREIHKLDERLQRFRYVGSSMSERIGPPVFLNIADIESKVLEKDVSRVDAGYQVWITTVDETLDVGFRIGSELQVGCNSVVMSLSATEAFVCREGMKNVLRAMVTEFNVEYGIVIPRSYYSTVIDKPLPVVGWMVYINAAPNFLPPFPGGVAVVPVATGSLIITTDEVFDSANPRHVAIAARVDRLLEEAHLIRATG